MSRDCGVAHSFASFSSPTCRFPFAVVPRFRISLSVSALPPFGTFGVAHITETTCRLVGTVRGPPFILAFIARCASGDLLSSFATGVGHIRAAPVNESVTPGWFPQDSASSPRGVAQNSAVLLSMRPVFVSPSRYRRFEPRSISLATAVGQSEPPIPLVAGAHGACR